MEGDRSDIRTSTVVDCSGAQRMQIHIHIQPSFHQLLLDTRRRQNIQTETGGAKANRDRDSSGRLSAAPAQNIRKLVQCGAETERKRQRAPRV